MHYAIFCAMNVNESGVHKTSNKCVYHEANINQIVKVTNCVPCLYRRH